MTYLHATVKTQFISTEAHYSKIHQLIILLIMGICYFQYFWLLHIFTENAVKMLCKSLDEHIGEFL